MPLVEITRSDDEWMQQALSLAQQAAAMGEVPVGAILVDASGQCIGEGYNQPISSHDCTAHAEVIALRAAGRMRRNYRLPDCTLYVTIEPCTMCVGAMVHARIGRLVFGAPEPKAGAVCSQNNLLQHSAMNTTIDWTGGVLQQECTQLIQQFFADRRKQKAADKKKLKES